MREREDGFVGFLEVIPEAVIVHDGETIQHVNRTALDMSGADSTDRMVGMHLAVFLRPVSRSPVSGRRPPRGVVLSQLEYWTRMTI